MPPPEIERRNEAREKIYALNHNEAKDVLAILLTLGVGLNFFDMAFQKSAQVERIIQSGKEARKKTARKNPRGKRLPLVIYQNGNRVIIGEAELKENGEVLAQLDSDIMKKVVGDKISGLSFGFQEAWLAPGSGPVEHPLIEFVKGINTAATFQVSRDELPSGPSQ